MWWSRAVRLEAARRQADVVGKAMADAEEQVMIAAWSCVQSGHTYQATAAMAGVSVEVVRGWVAEVSDPWGSPAGV